MSRYLVTGGAGFIGSNLALTLQNELGAEVVVLDDFSTGNFKNLEGFRGDLVGESICSEEWRSRVGEVDAIFHEAAITDTTVHDQKLMMQVNVEGFRNILTFARDNGVKRVVYASSAGVYGNGDVPMVEDQELRPENVYGFSKKVMDKVAADFSADNTGVTVVGLRYFNVYGPREGFKGAAASMIWQLYNQMKAGKRPRIFKFGEQSRDFVYVKDVVQANLRALETMRGGVYNAGSGQPGTFNQIVDGINRILGSDLAPDYFDNPYDFYQDHTLADLGRARSHLKYKPEFSLADGIQDYLGGKPEPVAVGS